MPLRIILIAAVLGLTGCTQDPSPTTTSEAQFTINPGTGARATALVRVELSAGNASHVISQSLPVPYMFFIENAFPPVQGIFQPESVDSFADVELLFGGETVPRIVTSPDGNSAGCPVPALPGTPSAFCVNNCQGNMSMPGECLRNPMPGPVEVRFDVASVPITLFTANVGSINQDHIVSTAQTPATIFLEDPQENAQGVFTKFDPNATLTVTLYVDGVARDTGTSPPFNTNDVIVQYQFD